MPRISREEMFMEMAETAAKRSTCERAQVGAIIVKNGRVISIGYAGAPSGLPHCLDVGCGPDAHITGCQRTSHAESNAIAFAARSGISLEGSSMYVTLSPCETCAKLIINSGIREVYYRDSYRKPEGNHLLARANLIVAEWKVLLTHLRLSK